MAVDALMSGFVHVTGSVDEQLATGNNNNNNNNNDDDDDDDDDNNNNNNNNRAHEWFCARFSEC